MKIPPKFTDDELKTIFFALQLFKFKFDESPQKDGSLEVKLGEECLKSTIKKVEAYFI